MPEHALEGELNTLTLLAADVVGPAGLLEGLRPEDADAVIEAALQRMTSAIARYEGRAAQIPGRGIVALFGAELPLEDHAERALFAALAMQEEIRDYARTLRLERGVSLALRVGLDTGEAVARPLPSEDAAAGRDWMARSSLAPKLRLLATPGTVVVSERLRRRCEGRFRFRSLGPARLDAANPPVELYEVVGTGGVRTRLEAAERRGLSRFVGRDHELSQLGRALDLVKSGNGQVVVVIGEPGVGKSRLLYEFRRQLGSAVLVLETFGVTHGKTFPYLPVIELLKSYFQITPRDEEDERREKVVSKLLSLDPSLDDVLPHLFPLFEIRDGSVAAVQQMDPAVRRRRTQDLLKRILLAESASRPVAVIVEDLHWLDAESEAALSALAEGLGGSRVLLLVSARPPVVVAPLSRSYTTRIRLDPLGRKPMTEMLDSLLGADPSLDSLKHLIASRTEGNPFFIEEIVRELFENHLLDGNGGVRLTRPLGDIRLPATVEGVLASRLDRLPAGERDLLQTMAVLGRVFSLSLAEAVTGRSKDDLRGVFASLQRAELLYERPAFPEPDYTFKHALTREIAYGSLSIERRRSLHERAAEAIERLFFSCLGEHYGDLAHHHSNGGNVEKAIHYLHLAGEQALRRSANGDAAAHLGAALELLESRPRDAARNRLELELRLSLAPALVAIKGYASPETEATLRRAEELSSADENGARLLPILLNLASLASMRVFAARELDEIIRKVRAIFETTHDPDAEMIALRLEGSSSLYAGRFQGAREALERAVHLHDPVRHRDRAFEYGQELGVAVRSILGRVLWHVGLPDRALRMADAAVELGSEQGHALSHVWALVFRGMVLLRRREPETLEPSIEAALDLATRHGFPIFAAAARILRGWAAVQRGRTDPGFDDIERGMREWMESGANMLEDYRVWHADACLVAGRLGDARRLLEEEAALLGQPGVTRRFAAAEVFRLQAEVALRSRQDAAHIEALFRRSVAIAREQRALSLELRATLGLARLLDHHARTGEASSMLADVYSRFTEGFDTRDLAEARAFLEELRSAKSHAAPPAASDVALATHPTKSAAVFRREAHFWTIGREAGAVMRLKDSKGLRFLAHLLRHPGVEFGALEVAAIGDEGAGASDASRSPGKREREAAGLEARDLGDAGEILDRRAKAEYRRRLADLRTELDEAEANNDRGRAEALRGEVEALSRELAAAVGLGGRDRRAASSSERARVAVTKAIRSAIATIEKEDADLGSELRQSVRTGNTFCYRPGPARRDVG